MLWKGLQGLIWIPAAEEVEQRAQGSAVCAAGLQQASHARNSALEWLALENFPLLMYILAAKTLILCLAFAGVKMYQSKKIEEKLKREREEKLKAEAEKKDEFLTLGFISQEDEAFLEKKDVSPQRGLELQGRHLGKISCKEVAGMEGENTLKHQNGKSPSGSSSATITPNPVPKGHINSFNTRGATQEPLGNIPILKNEPEIHKKHSDEHLNDSAGHSLSTPEPRGDLQKTPQNCNTPKLQQPKLQHLQTATPQNCNTPKLEHPQTGIPPNWNTLKLQHPKTGIPQIWNTPKLQHPKTATPPNCNTPKLEYPKSGILQNCNTPNCNTSKLQHPKTATPQNCNTPLCFL
ncbi:hypothetical protein IHE44_0004908 [Lamprotornis superbus]|uniref:Uncharacterized protein n=4 Tax=Passeriformes TaxID=9126 RepID=A0A835NGG3_9PASS|nr:hypothetical protein IHE44_0004908 [Lamprotornis superbus]